MPKNKITNKSKLDKFYTKPEVAIKCIDKIDLSKYDLIIEPSAGNGSFSKNIKHKNLISLDLLPEDKSITKQDWLQYKIDSKFKSVLIIGNPPFGDRNKLSKEFIKHSLKFDNVKTIAFILPNVFNKHTNQSIFPKTWRLQQVVELENNSFLLEDSEYHVPCSLYIWDKSKGKDLRFDPNLYKDCSDFKFCTQEEADWFIMGAAPKVVKNIQDVNKNNRGYYIKATGITKEELKLKFEQTNWRGNSSVNGGAFWMTKYEIIKEYNGK